MKLALVIPIYCPSAEVIPFLQKFKREDFSLFLVIDDGSGEDYASIFEQIRGLEGFEVFQYDKNRGKGNALKLGFKYVKKNHPEIEGFVTADGDGQHAYEDILKVRDALCEHPDSFVLGARDFNGPNVPKLSKDGNVFSSFYCSYRTGKKVGDTQTGLRGFPMSMYEDLLSTRGSRYEYEMNVIINFVQIHPWVEVPVQTIYLNSNDASHFRPFMDTCRIYSGLILYVLMGIATLTLEEISYSVALCWNPFGLSLPLLSLSTCYPRMGFGLAMMFFGLFVYFPSHGKTARKVLRGLLLLLTDMSLHFGLTYGLLSAGLPFWGIILIKVVFDLILAGGDFYANMMWVFSLGKRKRS